MTVHVIMLVIPGFRKFSQVDYYFRHKGTGLVSGYILSSELQKTLSVKKPIQSLYIKQWLTQKLTIGQSVVN